MLVTSFLWNKFSFACSDKKLGDKATEKSLIIMAENQNIENRQGVLVLHLTSLHAFLPSFNNKKL